ncbi:MAG: hypothetical protein ACFFBD_03615 [Candidatus Hodarchaeota archaeon]
MKNRRAEHQSQQRPASLKDAPGSLAGHVTGQYKLYPPDYIPKTLPRYFPELFPPPPLPDKNTDYDPSQGYLSDELIDVLVEQYGVVFSSDSATRHLERKSLLQAILATTFPKSPLNEGSPPDPGLWVIVKGIPYGLKQAYFYYYTPKFYREAIINRYYAKALESFRKVLNKHRIKIPEGEHQETFAQQVLQAMNELASSPLAVLSKLHKLVERIPPRERDKLHRIYSQQLARVLPAQWARRQAIGLRLLRNELRKLGTDRGGLEYPSPQLPENKETFRKNVERVREFVGQCTELANDLLALAYREEHFWQLMPEVLAGDKTAMFLLYWYNEDSPDSEAKDTRRTKLIERLKTSKKLSNPEVLIKKYFKQYLKESKENDLTTTAIQDTCSSVAEVLRSDSKKRLLVLYVLRRVLRGTGGLELILRLLRNKHPPSKLIRDIITSLRTDQAEVLGLDSPKTIRLTFKYTWLRGVLTQIRALFDYSLLHDHYWPRFLDLTSYRVWQTPQRQQNQRQEVSEYIETLQKDLTIEEQLALSGEVFRPYTLRYGSSRRQFIRAMLYLLGDEDQDVQKLIQTLKPRHKDKAQRSQTKFMPPLVLVNQPVVTKQGSPVHLDLPTYLAQKSGQKKKASLDNYPASTQGFVRELLTTLQDQVMGQPVQDIYALPVMRNPAYVAVVQGRKMNSTIFLSEEDEEGLKNYVFKVQVKMSRNKDDEVTFRAVNWFALKQLELDAKKRRLATEQLDRIIKDLNILHLASVLTGKPLDDPQTLEQARETVGQNISRQKEWYNQLNMYLQNGMQFERQGTEVFTKQIKLKQIKNALDQNWTTLNWLINNRTEEGASITQNLMQTAADPGVYLGENNFLQEVSKWLVWDCCWQLQELNAKVQHKLVKRLARRRQLSEPEQEVVAALNNSKVLYVTLEDEADQTDLDQILQMLKAQWAYHQDLLTWYGQVAQRPYKWSATDGRRLACFKHLNEISSPSTEDIIQTWVNIRSKTKRTNQKRTSGSSNDKPVTPTQEQIQALVRRMAQLLPQQDQPGLILALAQEKIDKRALKDHSRPHEYCLLIKGQHAYLHVVFDRPKRPEAPKISLVENVCGNDRGIRKANVLAYGVSASTAFRYVHIHNSSIIAKKARQNQDLRYSQQQVSKSIPPELEGEAYRKALLKVPTHIQKTAHKIQSVHAKKYRMNKTFVHELTARTLDTVIWTNTTTMVLEYGLSEFQAPAGQGTLSQALSQNLWGKYEEVLDYKLASKTDHPVKIVKTSAVYSSQICSQQLGVLIKEWEVKGLPPEVYQEGFRKALVCPECYPVSAPGSTRHDSRGEWFYCAGHTIGEKQTPPTWTDRDENASQNLTYLHWLDIQKDAQNITNNHQITKQLDPPTLSLEESTSRRRHSDTDEVQFE